MHGVSRRGCDQPVGGQRSAISWACSAVSVSLRVPWTSTAGQSVASQSSPWPPLTRPTEVTMSCGRKARPQPSGYARMESVGQPTSPPADRGGSPRRAGPSLRLPDRRCHRVGRPAAHREDHIRPAVLPLRRLLGPRLARPGGERGVRGVDALSGAAGNGCRWLGPCRPARFRGWRTSVRGAGWSHRRG